MPTELTALNAGIEAANQAANGPAYEQERADVKKWAEKIEKARKFDDVARKQYAIDRRMARGDTRAEVAANIVGTYIDILKAFLYAKDPDVDVLPARSTEPPSEESVRDAAMQMADSDPQVQAVVQKATMAAVAQAVANGQDPAQAAQIAAQVAKQGAVEHLAEQRFQELTTAYRKRQRDNKAFAETLELVVSRMFSDAKLKRRGLPWVQSALTISVGWLKGSWQERKGEDPLVKQQIADLQDNVNKVVALRQGMEDASGDELKAQQAALERQLTALESQVERVIARGFAIDFVAGEDITVAPGVDIVDYLDAAWIDHRIATPIADALADFKLDPTDAKVKRAKKYRERKPVMGVAESPMIDNVTEKDADRFIAGDEPGEGECGEDFYMVHETWDRDANCILTWIEGMDCWARKPYPPVATSRFYGFFLLALGDVDGQRHPQSIVARNAKLVDEFFRIKSAEAEHRRRVMPKIVYLKGMVGPDSVKAVIDGVTGEYVGIETTQANADLRQLFVPVAYPALDPALYDTSRIINDLERGFGIQEALAGAVTVAKTATESQIQQTGMQARTGARRDVLEDALGEIAVYAAEVARARMSLEDVQAIVGPDAFWPAYTGPDDLLKMVNVNIRAGSSGKPDTTAQQQAWSTILPQLQQGVQTVGMLRNSTNESMADSAEKLIRMTVERTGDRIDVDSILPPAGPALAPVPPGTDPNTPPGKDAPAGHAANAGAPAAPQASPIPA
jgi:hypothetical protein